LTLRNPDLYVYLIRIPPLLFALTIHEFAHAWAAYRCGDPTAKDLGRLTFNPLAHLDPLGTICLLFAPFGWAKPVPVNPYNFRHPRRDDILVSVAGVAANLATAIIAAGALRLALHLGFQPAGSPAAEAAADMALVLVQISVGLMLFNLIPIPPLDGSHVLRDLLPYEAARFYDQVAPFTSFLLVVLVVSHGFDVILGWPHHQIVGLLLGPAS
jgi:Zn-dependent protease